MSQRKKVGYQNRREVVTSALKTFRPLTPQSQQLPKQTRAVHTPTTKVKKNANCCFEIQQLGISLQALDVIPRKLKNSSSV